MSPALFSRQQTNPNGNEVLVDNGNDWWETSTAFIVKWSILGAIILFFFVWFVGGHIHARRRIRKGLPPLRYHRFLVPEAYRPQPPPPPQNQFTFYRMENQGYNLEAQSYPDAQVPPAYHADHKIDPNQAYDVPPPGDPPSEQQQAPEQPLPPRVPKKSGIMSRINPFHK